MRFKGILSLLSRRSWGALADSGALERAQLMLYSDCIAGLSWEYFCAGNTPQPPFVVVVLFCK